MYGNSPAPSGLESDGADSLSGGGVLFKLSTFKYYRGMSENKNMGIPAEAVEAAARWLQSDGEQGWLAWDDIEPFGQEQYRTRARNILEAAAPYMQTPANNGGDMTDLRGTLSNTICNVSFYPKRAQPYLLGGDMGEVLDRTANAILAGGYWKAAK